MPIENLKIELGKVTSNAPTRSAVAVSFMEDKVLFYGGFTSISGIAEWYGDAWTFDYKSLTVLPPKHVGK